MRLSLMLLTTSLFVPLGLPAGVTSPALFQVQKFWDSQAQACEYAPGVAPEESAHKTPQGDKHRTT